MALMSCSLQSALFKLIQLQVLNLMHRSLQSRSACSLLPDGHRNWHISLLRMQRTCTALRYGRPKPSLTFILCVLGDYSPHSRSWMAFSTCFPPYISAAPRPKSLLYLLSSTSFPAPSRSPPTNANAPWARTTRRHLSKTDIELSMRAQFLPLRSSCASSSTTPRDASEPSWLSVRIARC